MPLLRLIKIRARQRWSNDRMQANDAAGGIVNDQVKTIDIGAMNSYR